MEGTNQEETRLWGGCSGPEKGNLEVWGRFWLFWRVTCTSLHLLRPQMTHGAMETLGRPLSSPLLTLFTAAENVSGAAIPLLRVTYGVATVVTTNLGQITCMGPPKECECNPDLNVAGPTLELLLLPHRC